MQPVSSLQRPPRPTNFEQALAELDKAWGVIDLLIERTAEIDRLSEQLIELQARNADLERELRELGEQAGKNSRNSSKPPSSDSPAQRAGPQEAQALLAQQGCAGRTHEARASVAPRHTKPRQPHAICRPASVPVAAPVEIEPEPHVRHQVFDIPVVRFSFVEHQLFRGRCARCGRRHVAQPPASVPSGQMGPNLIALITHLAGQFHLSIRDIQCFLLEHYGLEFSTGAISQAQGHVLPALAPAYQAIGDFVRDEGVVHADETRHFRGSSGVLALDAVSVSGRCIS